MFGCGLSNAQQLSTPYRADLYQSYHNPSLDPFAGQMGFQTVFRSRMTGVKGAPKQLGIGLSVPSSAIYGTLGLEIFTETLGFFSKGSARLSYVFDLWISEDVILSSGLSLNFNSATLSSGGWVFPRGTSSSDPIRSSVSEITDFTGLNASMFISVRSRKSYKLGFSVINVVEESNLRDRFGYSFSRLFNFYGEYNIKLSPSFSLKQCVAYLGIGRSPVDVYTYSLGTVYRGSYDIFLGLYSFSATSVSFGCLIVEGLYLSYAFNVGYDRESFFFPSHEIYLRYCFKFASDSGGFGAGQRNIRFL